VPDFFAELAAALWLTLKGVNLSMQRKSAA